MYQLYLCRGFRLVCAAVGSSNHGSVSRGDVIESTPRLLGVESKISNALSFSVQSVMAERGRRVCEELPTYYTVLHGEGGLGPWEWGQYTVSSSGKDSRIKCVGTRDHVTKCNQIDGSMLLGLGKNVCNNCNNIVST